MFTTCLNLCVKYAQPFFNISKIYDPILVAFLICFKNTKIIKLKVFIFVSFMTNADRLYVEILSFIFLLGRCVYFVFNLFYLCKMLTYNNNFNQI